MTYAGSSAMGSDHLRSERTLPLVMRLSEHEQLTLRPTRAVQPTMMQHASGGVGGGEGAAEHSWSWAVPTDSLETDIN